MDLFHFTDFLALTKPIRKIGTRLYNILYLVITIIVRMIKLTLVFIFDDCTEDRRQPKQFQFLFLKK